MSSFVFITDLHFKSSSKTRTGDLMDDLIAKLDWVVDYCNDNGAALLLGGDMYDSPQVQDYVKNRVILSLRRVVKGVYGISGNHDRLYDNPVFNHKTSWATLTTTGVVRDIDDGDIDFGDCVVSSRVPIVDKGKPCVFVFHGFLNQEDGRNTFRFTDIESHSHDTLIMLGHDHKVYDDLEYDSHTMIVRPGSFQRCIRADESNRQPKLVHLDIINGEISYKYIEIGAARGYNTIFETKSAGVSRSEVHASYEDVIGQINNASKTQLTFEEALRSCSTIDVVDYVLSLLSDLKYNNSLKRQNL